jgi:DNA polymerase I
VAKHKVGITKVSELPYSSVWAVDFEFIARPGELPEPVCLVAIELLTGRLVRIWKDKLLTLERPPYSTDTETLFVAYYASAEVGCHLALGWPVPVRILDLFTEHRVSKNGLPTICGNGLLGALVANGLEAMGAQEKDRMRDLILSGAPWAQAQKLEILDYCQSDVDALARLLPIMLPSIDLPRALLRGRYMAAVARMEANGVPIDGATLSRLQSGWDAIKSLLVERIDSKYQVFDGTSFRQDKFATYLARNEMEWPRLSSGQLNLRDDTFRDQAKIYPELEPLRGLRHALSQMRLSELPVGSDNRNRCLLSPYQSRTSRNQPSNSKFIFGPSAWLRYLIKPSPGYGLAYIDYSSQEIGIAAALSGDPLLIDAFNSGDPYLTFAKQVGAVPQDATKSSHKTIRDRFKAVVLGVNYGMGASALAKRIGCLEIEAKGLLELHQQTYRTFWHWSQAAVDTAILTGVITTTFGWPIHVARESNPRSLMNFPMQANGAEILRLACCMATEEGIEVCAPIHDAVLICAPLENLDACISRTQHIMAEASRIVLDGVSLRTDAEIVRWPERYVDGRGTVMWETVMELLSEIGEVAA